MDCPEDLPSAPLAERAAHLYACQMLSTYKIAEVTGANRRYISQLLRRAGVEVIPSSTSRGAALRAAEREQLDYLIGRLYEEQRMPSTQIAELVGKSEYAILSRLRARGVRIRAESQPPR